ncbi:MAG TPA: PDZ domain-containing protein, partial [Anaerolineales bacterium]|nr:PDZ domain-containing protein [Anaerolineales bacterium]
MPESKPSERSLRGIGLWLARFIYLLALVGIMALFFIGSPAYARSFQEGYMPMKIVRTAQGEIEITEVHDEVAQAGIQAGDILLAVNGTAIHEADPTEQVDSLLFGPIGQNVTLTVRTQGSSQLDVTVQRGQALLQTIQNVHLTLPIVIIFFVTVSTLMMLSFALISLLIFIRRSDDWYVILVA